MTELLRNHNTACPAYSTKGRDLEGEPCNCGARVPSARDTAIREAAKLEGAREVLDEIDRVQLTGIVPYPLRDRLIEMRAKYAAKAIR